MIDDSMAGAGGHISPCTQVCKLADAPAGEVRRCTGCGRTRDEIAGWSSMSVAARQAVMAGLAGILSEARGSD